MKTFITPILTSAALVAAIPALAADDAESDIMGVCDGALMPADSNADGIYSQTEIDALRNAEFEQLDVNKDGSIDREEYVACMKGARDAEVEKAAELEDRGDFEMNKWPDLSDADQMTREEYAAFAEEAWEEDDQTKKESVARMSDDEGGIEGFAHAAAQRFKSHDTDGNGIITQEEYENSARGAEFDDAALEQRFDNLDADGSGGISPQEYRPAGVWAHGALGGGDASADAASDDTATDQSAESETGDQTADAQDANENSAEDGKVSIIRYYMLSY